MRKTLLLAGLIGPFLILAACGPQNRNPTPAGKPAGAAVAKPAARKCPDVNNRNSKDPCSASYIAPYKPAFKRDRF